MSRDRAPTAHAQADLPVALRNGQEHDVHDPDPADEQRDQGNAEEQARDEAHGSLDGMDDLGEVLNRENRRALLVRFGDVRGAHG